MDAIALLRQDHLEVLGMFDQIEAGPSVETGATDEQLRARKQLVTELVIAESQHEAVEEQFFWPAVRDGIPDGPPLAAEATQQETEAKHVLDQLDKTAANEPKFEQLLSSIIKDGREHIEFEQNSVWPKVVATFSKEKLDELGEKMGKAKAMAPTRPHPYTPSDPITQKTAGMAAAMTDRVRDAVTGRGKRD